MANGELAERTKYEIKQHGSIYGLSQATGVNPGVIYRVKEGGESPTLRRLWKVPKHPKRTRLMVSCSQKTIDRYDSQRGKQSRREYLNELLDMADGEMEMEI